MLDDIKSIFKSGNFTGQIILINAAVFLVVNILENISPKAGTFIYDWFALHSHFGHFVIQPWSLFTYMFMHAGLSHILFNMLVFYWFSRIVSDFMGAEKLKGIYFLGGLSGGVFYLLVYNLMFLAGEKVLDYPLVGASAAVMALVVVAGMKFPTYQMNLLLIGPVQLRYVALGLFIISTLLDLSENFGGKMSHLGGAAFGYFYVRSLRKGTDYTQWFSDLVSSIKRLFSQSRKMKTVHRNPGYHAQPDGGMQAEDQARMDAILDKISKSGYDNLTKAEKEFLFRMSNKK
ncbi:MAG: rhomboid family intramembrane serine protease [Salibacteraceae bacterium]